MTTKKKMLGAAAGTAAAGGAGLDITDVFSTYLYEGTGSALTVNNGIDLSGEGGLVWWKSRSTAESNVIIDTERGAGNWLITNTTGAQIAVSGANLAFNSTGYSQNNSYSESNASGVDYASWTFRKAPKFFDVVTYTGDGIAGRTVAHNLGSVPGMVIVKQTNAATIWPVYHRGVNGGTNPENYLLYINGTAAQIDSDTYWNDTAPTDSVFTVGTNSNVNTSGGTYVAYLFAHNDSGDGEFGPTGDQDIIKCGSYTGNGSADGPEIDLGFEPQWLLVKNASVTSHWRLVDTMRGFDNSDVQSLFPNLALAESNFGVPVIVPTPTGFKLVYAGLTDFNASGNTYIYMAIRRGPLAPPTAGTEVFAPNFYGTSGYVGYLGAPADMSMLGYRSGNSQNAVIRTRMLSNTKGLVTSSTAAEVTTSSSWDNMSGVSTAGSTITTLISWTWKRAPSFFDAVAYTGTGSPLTLNHNLGVAPELVLYKSRSAAEYWFVQSSELTSVTDSYVFVNYDNAESSAIGTIWRTPDATTFGVDYTGNLTGCNTSGATYIAYLFATLAGVSKVGSVTHSGTTNVDCGFSAGARFVLLKRTDATGDWYIWDSVRGIVSGNDPYLLLNSTAAEVTNTDYIDPLSSGFTITSTLTAGDYIFYAIA